MNVATAKKTTPTKGWTDAQELLAERLWVAGENPVQIAAALKTKTRNAVVSWLKSKGLNRPREVTTLNQTLRPEQIANPAPKVRYPPAVALPGSTPRPWETRRFGECAFPIDSDDGLMSCCLKVKGDGQYCKGHCRVMYAPVQARKSS